MGLPEAESEMSRAEDLRRNYFRVNDGWISLNWSSVLFRKDTEPEEHLKRIRELNEKLLEAEADLANKNRALKAAQTKRETSANEVRKIKHEIDCRKLDMADKLGVPS